MAVESDSNKLYCVKFDLARISRIENREYDLVLEIQAQDKSVYTFAFENTVKITVEAEPAEWKPGSKLSLGLLDKPVEEISIWKSGHLRIVLNDGILECEPDERYEAWTMFSPEKQFICLAGGDFSIFTNS